MCVGATGSAACSTNTNSPRSDRSRFPNWQPVCLRSAPLKSCASLAGGVSVDLLSAKRIGKRRPSRPEPVKVETNQISGTYRPQDHSEHRSRLLRGGGRLVEDLSACDNVTGSTV